MKAYFITATDTDAGKTFVTTQLLKSWNQYGYKTMGFKPVASGCQRTNEGLYNDDALKISAAASVSLPYEMINPYAFEPAIAPHIAAAQVGVTINIQTIANGILQQQEQVDRLVVEGVGGWLVPLNEQQTVADLAVLLNFSVILVVNLRLGCINQALLSAQAIELTGMKIAGWIANNAVPEEQNLMTHQAENIDSLKARLKAPLLGVLPYFAIPEVNNGLEFIDFVDMEKCCC
ncbi:MAG: dethiobiotin synthase [gamma proteobacterium symbiont of Bathyaustriella thionipta]|nr:dethiobiotin synthase [gamma proteobacterium symbiont of Bathyaustriella thionipta]MCU7949134.1 dethiobiotin synthase [gamma proteobacterium symbiont of Bathyaustriella thionipta]MCU7952247.1 dethiobiotin synthase [gamma proteobacterium symbiont of Bathyaustriella thionipta]MCU7955797.1 dethiobiotin synthase [gamma proteobacterium symbiont of Bathyaustriella thionipta]MCU7968035.1 dethiobiotin synthase [gamma proteobacterium symbiont of Bathyaustriella thionipta]